MTEQEAIEELKNYRVCGETCYPTEIEVAITDLEEIQQYRAIGTVEKVKEYKEIADNISAVDLATLCIALGNLREYQSIGTVKECREAAGKLREKKVMAIVNQVSAEHNNGWILCSDRLPEDGKEVLVTRKGLNGYYVTCDEYDWDYDAWTSDADDIIAWQPLPEPCRGSENSWYYKDAAV